MNQSNKPVKQGEQTTPQTLVKHTQIKGEIFHSNYPPPEMLQKYAELDPTFPDRLLKMAENEGDHRRRMERRLSGWSIFLDLLGTILAAGVVISVFYIAYWFMKNGYATEAKWITISVAVALAIAFLTRGKKVSQKN